MSQQQKNEVDMNRFTPGQYTVHDTLPIQNIRDDVNLNTLYPDMQTCSEEELMRRFEDLLRSGFAMDIIWEEIKLDE